LESEIIAVTPGNRTVQFLGSGDAFGSGGRLQTCIHVDAGDFRFLIDCGTSSLIGMRRWGVSPDQIDAIFITHLHGDHFGGIPFLLLENQFISKRTGPLTIVGPPGIEDRSRDAQEALFQGSSRLELRFPVHYLELQDGARTEVGPAVVTPSEVVHMKQAPSYALRIECGGRVVVYSGDTAWTDSLIQAVEGADLFICECYKRSKGVPLHLDLETLLEHRDQLRCKRLILTHLSQEMLDQVDRLDFEVAEDGKRVSLE
jgi:ribonuclease BN (tRNA processing enzyme)